MLWRINVDCLVVGLRVVVLTIASRWGCGGSSQVVSDVLCTLFVVVVCCCCGSGSGYVRGCVLSLPTFVKPNCAFTSTVCGSVVVIFSCWWVFKSSGKNVTDYLNRLLSCCGVTVIDGGCAAAAGVSIAVVWVGPG